MKPIKLVLFLLIPLMGLAQAPPKEPKFMGGGLQGFFQYMTNEINFSKVEGEADMRLAFYLDQSGTINDIKLTDFKNQAAADEIKRILVKSPKWDMSNQDKNYVPVYKIKLIFEQGKVKGTTQTSWVKKESVEGMLDTPASIGSENEVPKNEDSVYDIAGIEKKPEFPGGTAEFYRYIGKTFRTPDVKGLSGKIFVTFVIEKDGSVTDIKVIRDIGYGTADEIKTVLENSPTWIPGEQNGKKVRTLFALPITIQPSK